MHEHLDACSTPIGEEVGMVRLGAAEDMNDADRSGLGAGAHVQWRRRGRRGLRWHRKRNEDNWLLADDHGIDRWLSMPMDAAPQQVSVDAVSPGHG